MHAGISDAEVKISLLSLLTLLLADAGRGPLADTHQPPPPSRHSANDKGKGPAYPPPPAGMPSGKQKLAGRQTDVPAVAKAAVKPMPTVVQHSAEGSGAHPQVQPSSLDSATAPSANKAGPAAHGSLQKGTANGNAAGLNRRKAA